VFAAKETQSGYQLKLILGAAREGSPDTGFDLVPDTYKLVAYISVFHSYPEKKTTKKTMSAYPLRPCPSSSANNLLENSM
jgi:hypothetical protein